MPGATCDTLAAPGTAWEARDAPTTSALMLRIKNPLDFSKPPARPENLSKKRQKNDVFLGRVRGFED